MSVWLAAEFKRFACVEYALLVVGKCVREVFVVVFYRSDPLTEFLKILATILGSVLVETRAPACQQRWYVVLVAWSPQR
jgi:hypothetical protein